MSSITRAEKIYLFAVGFLALLVGFFGYFLPSMVNLVIPWLVPALHARFLGSMYLSGVTFMTGCLLAKHYAEIRVVIPMIAIWTGTLFIISLFYLDEFDYSIPPTYIWFAAYLIYPLIALWIMWKHKSEHDDIQGTRLPTWARVYLIGQGIVITLLALAMLISPSQIVDSWPWKITPLLAQLYSAPFLSYGIGSFLLSQRKTWAEVRVALQALLVFALSVLIASFIHLNLFSPAELSDQIWFGGFIVATLVLGMLSFMATRLGKLNTI